MATSKMYLFMQGFVTRNLMANKKVAIKELMLTSRIKETRNLTHCFSCRRQLATSLPPAFEERTVQLPGQVAHLHGQGPQ